MKRVILPLLLIPTLAFAADVEHRITISDHQFSPAELRVPAGKKIKLIVQNRDSTPEEFESHSLKREKVIPGNATATIYVGPLSPGQYAFVGEFHEKTARGVIVAE
jgi:plastocyanin